MGRAVIPGPVIAILSKVVSDLNTHAGIDSLLSYAGAPGDPPVANKVVKVQDWLRRTNKDESVDPMDVLGKILESILDADPNDGAQGAETRERAKEPLRVALSRCGLVYAHGGIVSRAGLATPSKSFETLIRSRNLAAVDEEFKRALQSVETKPRDAVSAACNTLEAICKVYIHEEKLEPPSKQDLQGLWGAVRKDLGFDPSAIEDRDLKEILSGLLAVANGIGALRTHASSAHGAGPKAYRLEPRHARLAVHAAHTVSAFLLESWARKSALVGPGRPTTQ